jgi:predicted DNA-binding transcriptional regulator YafY
MTSAERVLRILRRLTREPATINQLVAMVGDRDEKTIRRDINAIRRAGFFVLRVAKSKCGAWTYRVK